MFLVRDRELNNLVFLQEDPRADGYQGDFQEDVSLDYPADIHVWPDGTDRPEVVAGVSDADPNAYKVFKYSRQIRPAGYTPVGGNVWVYRTWADYAVIVRAMTGKPLDPEVYRRVRERGEKVTEELRRRYGTVEIAVDLIREGRDEE
jgi:hypothetical protein